MRSPQEVLDVLNSSDTKQEILFVAGATMAQLDLKDGNSSKIIEIDKLVEKLDYTTADEEQNRILLEIKELCSKVLQKLLTSSLRFECSWLKKD